MTRCTRAKFIISFYTYVWVCVCVCVCVHVCVCKLYISVNSIILYWLTWVYRVYSAYSAENDGNWINYNIHMSYCRTGHFVTLQLTRTHTFFYNPFIYKFVFYFIAKSCMNMQTLTRENDRLYHIIIILIYNT